MATATVDGLSISYEVRGEGRPWVITPGGRFSKDTAGVRELATALADAGNKVLIWDRPNTGESDVCFTGPSESAMQADALAAPAATSSCPACPKPRPGSSTCRPSCYGAGRRT